METYKGTKWPSLHIYGLSLCYSLDGPQLRFYEKFLYMQRRRDVILIPRVTPMFMNYKNLLVFQQNNTRSHYHDIG
jgi:hypothetical protein